MDKQLDEKYLTWLYARIGNVEETRPSRLYWRLFGYLFMREFTWFVPNDDNRVADGKDMRYEFLDEMGLDRDIDQHWMGMGCSVLEMIMGVAACLSFVADGSPQHWFWELMTNLGLAGYTDRAFNERQVAEIVDRLIDRTYQPDGQGGLFPLQNAEHDQREVEIWYQLNEYIQERR